MERLASDKHSNLLSLFISYEENEVLWIRPQECPWPFYLWSFGQKFWRQKVQEKEEKITTKKSLCHLGKGFGAKSAKYDEKLRPKVSLPFGPIFWRQKCKKMMKKYRQKVSLPFGQKFWRQKCKKMIKKYRQKVCCRKYSRSSSLRSQFRLNNIPLI